MFRNAIRHKLFIHHPAMTIERNDAIFFIPPNFLQPTSWQSSSESASVEYFWAKRAKKEPPKTRQVAAAERKNFTA